MVGRVCQFRPVVDAESIPGLISFTPTIWIMSESGVHLLIVSWSRWGAQVGDIQQVDSICGWVGERNKTLAVLRYVI